MNRLWRAFLDHVVFYEGSTRVLGLLRIGLALILWSRWAGELSPWFDPDPKRLALGVFFFIGTSLMLAGYQTPVAMALMSAVMLTQYYVFGVYLDIHGWAGHHSYLLVIMTVLLALTPCGRSYSVDRWLAVRRARAFGHAPPPEHGELWPLRLLGYSVALIYFWGAYDKSHIGFLGGDRLEMMFSREYFGTELPDAAWFHALLVFLSVGVVGFEYFLAVGLFVRRWHWWVLPAGFFLHAALYWLLPVSTFTTEMFLVYLVYLDPDQVHRWLEDVHGSPPVERRAAA